MNSHHHGSLPLTKRAFSLIELVLVVIIIGIMSAIAAPRIGGVIARQQIASAANRIVVDLGLARRQAVATSASVTFRFNDPVGGYRLHPVPGLDDPTQDYAVHLNDDPYKIDKITANWGGDSNIVFNGWGMPDSGGNITIELGKFARYISIDSATGKAEIVDSPSEADASPSPSPTPSPSPSPVPCKAKNEYCAVDSECCSASCDPNSGKCKDK